MPIQLAITTVAWVLFVYNAFRIACSMYLQWDYNREDNKLPKMIDQLKGYEMKYPRVKFWCWLLPSLGWLLYYYHIVRI